MPPHSTPSPARFLAPIALVAFAVALLIVVASAGIGGGDEDSEQAPAATTQRQERRTTERTQERRQPATYTVEVGDTLGAIAEETGVTVERLQELNPELDPQALVSGQEIQLRE